MEKIRSIIANNLTKHSHFEEYYKVIDVIQEHAETNPDICIESCKALIEGVCKTILINLDNTKTTENIDRDDLPKLFKDAMRKLSDECSDLDGDFAARFSAIIQVIGEIRNKRSDISHGRMAPKFIFSSSKLASTVVNMTESMLEYILEHYFKLDFENDGILVYESEDMEAYNTWLDDSVDFPIKKARYSKLLYENDYDEYESRYSDEYLKSKEEDEIEQGSSVQVTEEKTIEPETQEKAVSVGDQKEKQIENLVTDFDEESFWTEANEQALKDFAEEENLKDDYLKEVVNEYLFSEKPPLRDDIARTMVERPKLTEFKTVVPNLTDRIMAFANDLKNPEAEA